MKRALAHKMPQVARNWRMLADEALAEFRVSNSAGWCLVHLSRMEPEARQADLAEQLGITQPSLVRTLDQLEEKGLISRQTCASDRRAKRIKLTEKAAPIITEMEAVISKTRGEILSGISPEELEMLIGLVARLEQNIHELQSRD